MESQRQRRERERDRDHGLAVLAHELRNPLAVLNNAAELLARLAVGNSSLERVSGIVMRQTAVMRSLVEQLLDTSRFDSERVELSASRLDLCAIARDALHDYRSHIEQAGLRCELSLPTEPVWVVVDPLKLDQVLGNLLSNAVKFTPQPGTVRVEVEATASHASLSVRDTGIGVAPELLPVIFERFRQARPGSHGGLGLGLPIARELIERHGGTIEVASDGLGTGCCVRIRLPLVRSSE